MRENWHSNVFFGMHFDLHMTDRDNVLGLGLTVEQVMTELEKVRPDFVQCDCKGHFGYAGYPTGIGVPAPVIVNDALKLWREAARRMDIPLVVHYSGLWDEACLKAHPEWGRVDLEDGSYEVNTRLICTRSDYIDQYFIPQAMEIIDKYDVDGFWVDGDNWACAPCYCGRCTAQFIEQTGRKTVPQSREEAGWTEWLQFHRNNFDNYVEKYTRAIHSRKPECTVCSNWMYTVRQPDRIKAPVDYLSGDFSSTWSIARANMEARFMDSRNMDWELMAWSFIMHRHLKPGDLKSISAMCQEAAVVMACGGRFLLYDMPERTGKPVEWHMDAFSEVAGFCRKRREFCRNTHSVPQIAILHTRRHFYRNNDPLYLLKDAHNQIEGCLHAVSENNYHADIISDADLDHIDIKKYPLVVLPEQEDVEEKLVICLKEYVKGGGALIVSGAGHTSCFDAILGVRSTGVCGGGDTQKEVFIPVDGGLFHGMGTWRMVEATEAEEVEPLLLSRSLDGYGRPSGSPAATVKKYGKGTIAGIYGPVFESYALSHYPGVRKFVGKILEAMDIPGLMKTDAPARISVSLRKSGDRLMVHFVNFGCDHPLSPQNVNIENIPPAGPVKLKLPLEARPARVFLAPEERPVKWEFADGMLYAGVQSVEIHDILVIEG